MPELPEVETTRRGIEPHIAGQRIAAVRVRERRLRWPVADGFEAALTGRRVDEVRRRAKYLLIDTIRRGEPPLTLIVHLGMSGSLRLVTDRSDLRPHDHVQLHFSKRSGGSTGRGAPLELRYHDPRRFGSMHLAHAPDEHFLLGDLGPEPLGPAFSGAHLYSCSRGRRVGVKQFIMEAGVVVGVGNIYASEALFEAGIHPTRPAGRVSLARYERLAEAIRAILAAAIADGGTTLRDFVNSAGEPGYFAQSLRAYGRTGEPCRRCGEAIRQRVVGQRSTFFCPRCQR